MSTDHDQGWAANIKAAGTGPISEDQAAGFLEALHAHGPVVTAIDGEYEATFSVHGDHDARSATTRALGIFRKAATRAHLPEWEITRLELVTFDEQDADLDRPALPPMVGVTEAAELLGVSRQRLDQIRKKFDDFPEPLVTLAAGTIWDRNAVVAFDERWDRTTGRPSKAKVDVARRRREAQTELEEASGAGDTARFKAAQEAYALVEAEYYEVTGMARPHRVV